MKRVFAAFLVAAIAGGALIFESTPRGQPIRAGLGEWLAANALPAQAETITLIELPSTGTIRALDAALVLRVAFRYRPRAIVFLDPIEPDGAETLLLSKLSEAAAPVVFTANDRLATLLHVAISKALPSFPPRRNEPETSAPIFRDAWLAQTMPAIALPPPKLRRDSLSPAIL